MRLMNSKRYNQEPRLVVRTKVYNMSVNNHDEDGDKNVKSLHNLE